MEKLFPEVGRVPRSPGDEARVWIIRLAAVVERWPDWAAVLSEAERTRMGRFLREEDRLRFGVARAMLRVLLGHGLGLRPADVVFSPSRFGRPQIVGGPRVPLCFSVSHSGHYALIGLARRRPIGVDVEWMRPGATLADIVTTICGPDELPEVRALSATGQPADLHARWTIKEAYIKAIGLGLSYDPKSVRVVRVSGTWDGVSGRAGYALKVRGRWTLTLPEVAPGYGAAVAVFGDRCPVDFIRIE